MAEITPEKLHGYAVAAEKNLEQLATGLASAGAPDNVTKTVTQMADGARKLVTALPGAAQAAPSPEQAQQPETIDSATDSMMAGGPAPA